MMLFKKMFFKKNKKEVGMEKENNSICLFTKEELTSFNLNKLGKLFIQEISKEHNINKERFKIYNIIQVESSTKYYKGLEYRYVGPNDGSVVLLKDNVSKYSHMNLGHIEKLYDKKTMIEYLLTKRS